MARYGRGIPPRGAAKIYGTQPEIYVTGNVMTFAMQSMESGSTDWLTGTGASAIAQSSTQAYQGISSLRATINSSSLGNSIVITNSQPVISASTSYHFSYWVYSPKACTYWGGVDWRTSGGVYISSDGSIDFSVSANTWTEITFDATAPGTAGKFTMLLGEGASGATHLANGDLVYFDHVSVVQNTGGGSVSPNAETTSQTATAYAPTVSIKPNAETLTGAVVSNAPTALVKPNAGAVTAATVTNAPIAGAAAASGTVTATGTANAVTAPVFPGTVTGAATANSPTAANKPAAGTTTGTTVTNAPSAKVTANAGIATVTATAYDATGNASGIINANAGHAAVSATANAPVAANKPPAPLVSAEALVAEKKPVGAADEDWELIFDDEFNGSSLDTTYWQTGWFGSGITNPVNPSIEHVAYDPAQVTVSGGNLNIAIKSQSTTIGPNTYPYRSGIITTNPYDGRGTAGFEFTYGYAEARMFFPNNGAGVIANWPAWWITGQNWPVTGEIDIIEGLGGDAAAHFHSSGGDHGGTIAGDYTGWHTFGVRWEPDSIKWYYDGTLVQTVTTDLTNSPLYLVIDYSADGTQDNVPNALLVDYVRVWQYAVGPKISGNPNAPTGTATSNAPTGAVKAFAQTVTASATAYDVVDLRTVGSASESATAFGPTASVKPNAGTAAATATANSSAVAGTSAPATVTASATANAPTGASQTLAGTAVGATAVAAPTGSVRALAGAVTASATAYDVGDLRTVGTSSESATAYQPSVAISFNAGTVIGNATVNAPIGANKPPAPLVTGSVVANSPTPAVGGKPGTVTGTVVANQPAAQSATNAQAGTASATVQVFGLLTDKQQGTDSVDCVPIVYQPRGVTSFSTGTAVVGATAFQPSIRIKPNAGTVTATGQAQTPLPNVGRKPGVATVSVTLDQAFFDTNVPSAKLLILAEDRTCQVEAEDRTKLVSRT